MKGIKQWRAENFNLEKRAQVQSWVATRAAEEYQTDLFFFDGLRQREVQEDNSARTVREPVE